MQELETKLNDQYKIIAYHWEVFPKYHLDS